MMNGRGSLTSVIVLLMKPEGLNSIQEWPLPEDNFLNQLAVFELHLLNTFQVWHNAVQQCCLRLRTQ
jgi:hypothetical protein